MRLPLGSTAAASCLKRPSAGSLFAARLPHGSHSHTCPSSNSSQESQVPHGVAPPEQLCVVPSRIRYASLTSPSASKRIADAPPSCVSEFETRIQPPSRVEKQAAPSEARCQL